MKIIILMNNKKKTKQKNNKFPLKNTYKEQH